ncbi:YsnF/AvaK domain-containing protein [Nakamurella sp. PAMC28650]|uniref:YsnF/AvaK domain-containing protein n=1 Tax=Nakamurella sp. PAMC28650 TaxID=2762325 RepID=UPI00164E41D2|nr:YsnF/AvaK domain-containing protein [Nakamurella sp. PAMC28650]QNK82091.1 YsnF/AvaK domain-containing protein [Nakamurella sp. PAMC28650]
MTDLPVDPALRLAADSVAVGVGEDRNFLVRSEEQLRVSSVRVPSGSARLEKFVVTETQTITVEVSHEEYRLVQDPITDPGPAPRHLNRGGQLNTARWLYVNREEVVITKKVMPVERVRIEVYPVTEQRQITEAVRREHIDTSHPGDPDTPRPA